MIPNYPTFTLEHEIYDQVLKIVNVNANKNKKKTTKRICWTM